MKYYFQAKAKYFLKERQNATNVKRDSNNFYLFIYFPLLQRKAKGFNLGSHKTLQILQDP